MNKTRKAITALELFVIWTVSNVEEKLSYPVPSRKTKDIEMFSGH